MLRYFSRSEFNRLRLFVDSPFFNKNAKLRKLIQYIDQYVPQFDQQDFTYENAYRFVIGKEAYQKEVITKLLSKLFDLTEQFVFHDQLKKDSTAKKLALLKFYNQHNLINYFKSCHKQLNKTQQASTIKDEHWAFHQLQIEHEYAHFLSANSDHGTGDINLQATNDALDHFFIQKKLKYFCFIKNRERLVNLPYQLTFEKAVNEHIKNVEPNVLIWKNAFDLLCIPDAMENYQQLKANLLQYADQIGTSDKRVLYTYLQNATKYAFDDYSEELFALYKIQLRQGLLYENDYLLPITFKNIVSLALHLKQYEWTEEFILTHHHNILPSHKDSTGIYLLCKALFYFAKKNYSQALEELNQARIHNLYAKLEERRLRLKIYLELDYRSLFEDGVNSSRKFLSEHRTQIASYYLKASRNFLNIIFQLFNAAQYDRPRFDKLRKQVAAMDILPEKEWIIEKIDERNKDQREES
ncbi:MAG: hypothetical protein AAGG75_16795 [Bacteroidota bacterium]